MKKYMDVKNCDDDFDYVKEHRGSNPLLLFTWINYIKTDRVPMVRETVEDYLKHNLKFNKDDLLH